MIKPHIILKQEQLECDHILTIAANIEWDTTGWPPGGPEFGYVFANLVKAPSLGEDAKNAKVEFSFYNPRHGKNECGILITGPDANSFRGECHIHQGSLTSALFTVRAAKN